MAKSNPFDSIAKPKETAAKKSTKKVASVTDAIKVAVDTVISLKAKMAELEANLEDASETIRVHIRAQQDELGFKGDYSKSFSVAGNTGEVTYVTADKFSVPQTEAELEELRKILGKAQDQVLETRRTVTFLAADNIELVTKIMKVCEDQGIEMGQAFKVEDKVATKSGTDERVYSLLPSQKALDSFRAIAKQAKAAIK